MPIIAYKCANGHIVKKFHRQAKDAPAKFSCPAEDCYHDATRQLSVPSSVSKISVDNGAQARAVEIIPDIVELNQERNDKDYREED